MATSKTESRLARKGANDSLAAALADALADTDLSAREISLTKNTNLTAKGVQVALYGDTPDRVPDALHDRLTGMGFELADECDRSGAETSNYVTYIDTRY